MNVDPTLLLRKMRLQEIVPCLAQHHRLVTYRRRTQALQFTSPASGSFNHRVPKAWLVNGVPSPFSLRIQAKFALGVQS